MTDYYRYWHEHYVHPADREEPEPEFTCQDCGVAIEDADDGLCFDCRCERPEGDRP